jgi:hypothetical protein
LRRNERENNLLLVNFEFDPVYFDRFHKNNQIIAQFDAIILLEGKVLRQEMGSRHDRQSRSLDELLLEKVALEDFDDLL